MICMPLTDTTASPQSGTIYMPRFSLQVISVGIYRVENLNTFFKSLVYINIKYNSNICTKAELLLESTF